MIENKKIEPGSTIQTPGSLAWKRLMRNKPAVAGMVTIILSIVVAILGYLIIPDKTPYANEMILQLGTKAPGFKIDVLKIRKNKEFKQTNFLTTMFFGKPNPYDLIPLNGYHFDGEEIVINEFIGEQGRGNELRMDIVDVVYPKSISDPYVIVKNDSLEFLNIHNEKVVASLNNLKQRIRENLITKKTFLLGTDKFGRDILSRLVIGVRISLSVGFIAVLISLIIGVTLGAIAGYFKGWIDDLVMWFINVVWSIPTLLLVFAITLALGKGFWQIFVAVGLTMWVEVARIIRGQVLSVRELDFIEAARALGFNHARVVVLHVIPNCLGPLMVIAAANFAAAILIEAGLSFLGIGVQPPMPSWGMMIKEHYGFIIANDPFLAIIPGVAIMVMVFAFNLLGNGLRDALDVKTQVGGQES